MLSAQGTDKVVVAVRAEKRQISKAALAWALTHIVRPGDCITLLAVLSVDTKPGRNLWNFAKFNGDCGSSRRDRDRSGVAEHVYEISESCSEMVLQFNEKNQVGVRINVVSGSPAGVVAAEAKKAGANWVVLDRHLKEEEKHCMEELHCNIVVIKHSQPKVLRVNFGASTDLQPLSLWDLTTENLLDTSRPKHSTPVSSPEDLKTSFTRTTTEGSSISSSDAAASPLFVCEKNPLFERRKEKAKPPHAQVDSDDSFTSFGSDEEGGLRHLLPNSTSTRKRNKGSVCWNLQNHVEKNNKIPKAPMSRTLLEKFVHINQEPRMQILGGLNRTKQMGHVFNDDVRDAVSLSRNSSAPPPLCSQCQLKAPVFGKPPRWFDYRELEEATQRFSKANSLAQGGFGSVHRGVLADGQIVAVKQLNVTGTLADAEFCREVGVLSCAQHRNVVTLIGFCIEGEKRVLVYEYVCNGSLDFHLHGGRRDPLDWHSRYKIALGTARGLRYLHEDCRVGCIVHTDVCPNNILLTHDFEPLVGDFGVAKWQPELDFDAEQHTGARAFGYLAPKYREDAQITEKTDIYAFGVVLKELLTGRKTDDIDSCNSPQFLAEWYRHLLALEEQGLTQAINHKLVDPCLDPGQLRNCSHQLQAMAHAASLCLRHDPELRPPMSKVLRALEGGNAIVPLTLTLDSVGNRSGRLSGLSSNQQILPKGRHSRRLSE